MYVRGVAKGIRIQLRENSFLDEFHAIGLNEHVAE